MDRNAQFAHKQSILFLENKVQSVAKYINSNQTKFSF